VTSLEQTCRVTIERPQYSSKSRPLRGLTIIEDPNILISIFRQPGLQVVTSDRRSTNEMAWSAPSGDDARVYMPQYPEQSVSVGYPEHATGEAPHLYDESENSFFAVEMESTQSYVAVGTDSQTNDGSPPKIYGSEFATPNNNEGFSGIQDLMTASPLNAVSDAGNMQIMANEGCQHNPGHRLSINVTDYDHEQREFIDLGEAPQVLAENSAGYGMWSGGGPYHPCNADIVGNGHNNLPVPNDMPVHWENSTNRDMGRGPWNPVAASHGSYSANDPSLIGVSGSSSHWSGHGGYSSTSNAPETWPSSASNGPSNPGAMESMMPTTPWDLSKFNGGGRRESHVSSNSLSPVGSPFRGYDNASMTSPGNGYRGAGDTPSG
jgi:hypothetical protein